MDSKSSSTKSKLPSNWDNLRFYSFKEGKTDEGGVIMRKSAREVWRLWVTQLTAVCEDFHIQKTTLALPCLPGSSVNIKIWNYWLVDDHMSLNVNVFITNQGNTNDFLEPMHHFMIYLLGPYWRSTAVLPPQGKFHPGLLQNVICGCSLQMGHWSFLAPCLGRGTQTDI